MHLQLNIFCCAEDVCPILSQFDKEVVGAWTDTTINMIGSVVTYTCNDGYLFPDRTRVKERVCQVNGTWSEKPEDCIRKSVLAELM